jgi:hypothetical protein
VQHFLPNDRTFDSYDILANITGSLCSLAISTWYHKRMLERKRANKAYSLVPGDEHDDVVELGEGSGLGAQQSGTASHGGLDGIVHEDTAPIARSLDPSPTRGAGGLEAEVDNWDEHADDDAWDEEGDIGDGGKTPSASSAGEAEQIAPVKKRTD